MALGARQSPTQQYMAQRRSTLKKRQEENFREHHLFVYCDLDLNYDLFEASDIIKWLIKTYKWLLNLIIILLRIVVTFQNQKKPKLIAGHTLEFDQFIAQI